MSKKYISILRKIFSTEKGETLNNKTSNNNGKLHYYNLFDWWESQFSEKERSYILKKYNPMGSDSSVLIKDFNSFNAETVIHFLTGLQGWFTTLADEVISEKMLVKAESFVTDNTDVLDKNFLYSACIKHYYQKRETDVKYYNLAKEYCYRQIDLSEKIQAAFREEYKEYDGVEPPGIKGYAQIAIILEKEKAYKDALSICFEAKGYGWRGDWDERIARLEKKTC